MMISYGPCEASAMRRREIGKYEDLSFPGWGQIGASNDANLS